MRRNQRLRQLNGGNLYLPADMQRNERRRRK